MDENHIFYSTFKNQITDIVSIIAEVFVSLLKLDTDKIKSIVFSSDKRGINYFDIELTIMTIITIKHLLFVIIEFLYLVLCQLYSLLVSWC